MWSWRSFTWKYKPFTNQDKGGAAGGNQQLWNSQQPWAVICHLSSLFIIHHSPNDGGTQCCSYSYFNHCPTPFHFVQAMCYWSHQLFEQTAIGAPHHRHLFSINSRRVNKLVGRINYINNRNGDDDQNNEPSATNDSTSAAANKSSQSKQKDLLHSRTPSRQSLKLN